MTHTGFVEIDPGPPLKGRTTDMTLFAALHAGVAVEDVGPEEMMEAHNTLRGTRSCLLDGLKTPKKTVKVDDNVTKMVYEPRPDQPRYTLEEVLDRGLEQWRTDLQRYASRYRFIPSSTRAAALAWRKKGEKFVEPVAEKVKRNYAPKKPVRYGVSKMKQAMKTPAQPEGEAK